MSENLPRLDRQGIRNLLGLTLPVVILGMVVSAMGQENKEKDKEPSTKKPGSTVFVLLQVKEKVFKQGDIEGIFKQAAGKTADITVESIDPDFYRKLQNLTARLNSTKSPGGTPGKPFVRQLRTSDDKIEWEVHLNRDAKDSKKSYMIVTALDLITTKDGKTTTKTLKPAGPRVTTAEMRATLDPGVFIVRLSPTETPQQFIIRGESVTGKEEIKPLKGEWAASDRFYLVIVRNSTASYEDLLRRVQDDKVVGDALTDAELGQDLTFVFASYGFTLPRTGRFDRNYYIPYRAKLDKRTIARVWMLFPLKDAAAARKEYDKYKDLDGFKLVKTIRAMNPVRISDKEELTVSDKSAPRWIELGPDGKLPGFSRRIRLENIRGLAAKYPAAHRLIVYEFQPEGGGTPQGVLFDQDGQPVRVASEEVKEWPAGITAAAAGGLEKDKEK